MASYTHKAGGTVKFTGALAKANFEREQSIVMLGMLQRAGKEISALMRKETEPYDFEKTLSQSITWRTSKNSGNIPNPEHMIDAPSANNAVDVGSHAPHAWYREYGAGEHTSSEGANEFLANMKRWAEEKLDLHPDRSKADMGILWAIIKSIRKGPDAIRHEQGKQPFVAPVEPEIPGIASQISQDALTQMWAKLERKYKP